ncbi:hypothetical protein ACFLZ2_03480 [Candidatus Margulisiibacteriota bacterium]
METDNIEQVKEVAKINSTCDSKLEKKTKKINKTGGAPCIYFDDMLCRTPFCDLEICSKCPQGGIYCTDKVPNPLRKLLHKVIGLAMFFAAFLGEENIIYEALNGFMQAI